jgi:hypothetical protein
MESTKNYEVEPNEANKSQKDRIKLDPNEVKKHFECTLLNNAIKSHKQIRRTYPRLRGLNPLADEYCKAVAVLYETHSQNTDLYTSHLYDAMKGWWAIEGDGAITHSDRERMFTKFREGFESLWQPLFDSRAA